MDRLTQFFQGQLSPLSRIMIVAATLAILPAVVLPTWTITLKAPQYPDGLTMTIYPHTVKGDVREINLLNHYIGMHQIEPDEFPEFRFIPWFILRFFGFALLTALIARMPIAALGWMDFVFFGVVMLFTMGHWLYEFGNNLDPTAPLRVQPFTPHLIGPTKVGQFQVSSWPGPGAILMGLAGLFGPVIVVYEWLRRGKEPPDA